MIKMYSTTTLSLNDIVDTSEKYCGMEFLLNGRYIVIIGSRDIFIIMNDAGKNHIDKKLKIINYTETCQNNEYFVTKYQYTDLKNIYCVNKKDKLRYQNYFSTLHVLCITDYSKIYTKSKGYMYFLSDKYLVEDLIENDELVYWYMILKLFLIKDVIHLIFDFIKND